MEFRDHTLYMHEYGSLRLGTVLHNSLTTCQCAVQKGERWLSVVVRVGEERIHLVNVCMPASGYRAWKMELDELSGYLAGLGPRDKVMIAGDWDHDPAA